MRIRTLSFIGPAIVILCCTIWSSYAFAQQTMTLRVSKKLTSVHLEALSSLHLDPEQIDALERLVASSSKKVEIVIDKTQKIPIFVQANITFPKAIREPEQQGYHYFEQFKTLNRMKDPRTELKPSRTTRGRSDNINVRYQQYYKGIKVVSADLIVHLTPDGKLWFVQGKYVPDIDVSTTPAILKPAAIQIATEHFMANRGPETGFKMSPLEPGVLNPWIYDRNVKGKNILIWIVPFTEDVTGRQWTYYVDAQSGQILNILDSARFIDSEIWDRQNTGPTTDDELWYIDNALQTIPGATLDPETTDLNTLVTGYWNYLFNTFGVYSINSAGSPDGMQLVGHAYWWDPVYCPNNACWNCIDDQATFCQNMVQRDTVAHELTHGLVEHSGGWLEYQNQSGALNESFADIFGEFVDCDAGNCTWLYGTSRDLSNPLNLGQHPDHVGDTGNPDTDHPLYKPHCNPPTCTPDPGNDFGGVHTNNGVPNIVAYLIVNGTQPEDPHYNYHVKGIGLSKTEQLYYSTLVDAGLSSAADFDEARQVMVAVCQDFVSGDQHGFTDNDCCQVQNAWASVGVGSACSELSGSNVSGICSKENAPYFISDNATIPSGHTLTIQPDVDVYFFPNTKIVADGLLQADGSAGDIRFLSSRSNNGMLLSGNVKLQHTGEWKMPVNTFASTDTKPHAITLRDSDDVSSFIRIDKGFTINDVNVTLNIIHSRDSDLTVILESPDGTHVTLFSNVGGGGANFTNTTIDDEATTDITAGMAPFSGSFRPQNNLSAFDGENSRGYWRLWVEDTMVGQTGSLQSWSMTFQF